MNLRPYSESDRERLESLFDEFQDHFIPLDPLGRTRRLEGYGPTALRTEQEFIGVDGLFLVAEVDGVIAGFVMARVSQTTAEEELEVTPGPWGRVTELFVREEFRRHGIGKALMAEAEAFIRQRGCSTMRVSVFAPNHRTHAFYRGLGYTDRDIDLIKPLT